MPRGGARQIESRGQAPSGSSLCPIHSVHPVAQSGCRNESPHMPTRLKYHFTPSRITRHPRDRGHRSLRPATVSKGFCQRLCLPEISISQLPALKFKPRTPSHHDMTYTYCPCSGVDSHLPLPHFPPKHLPFCPLWQSYSTFQPSTFHHLPIVADTSAIALTGARIIFNSEIHLRSRSQQSHDLTNRKKNNLIILLQQFLLLNSQN